MTDISMVKKMNCRHNVFTPRKPLLPYRSDLWIPNQFVQIVSSRLSTVSVLSVVGIRVLLVDVVVRVRLNMQTLGDNYYVHSKYLEKSNIPTPMNNSKRLF